MIVWKNRQSVIGLMMLSLATLLGSISFAHEHEEFYEKLDVNGDFRLRYENTANQDSLLMRNRGVLRFRLGFKYPINDFIETGARISTGPQNNPRTSDITINEFGHDFNVKLSRAVSIQFRVGVANGGPPPRAASEHGGGNSRQDPHETESLRRAYLNFKFKNLFLVGGKFENPFLTTELVWDGDVAPQGVAGSMTCPTWGVLTPKITGMYFIVDEITAGADSYMGGGQAEFKFNFSEDWALTLAGAYYDYTINNLTNATGDILTNEVNADGTAYLSDFDLADGILKLEYLGLSERWPITLTGDYVHNFGATTSQNDGFGADLFFGRNKEKGDFRVGNGYLMAQNDAVLAAFSNDNTTIATNYKQHTLALDYVVLKNTFLNATWYFFRRDQLGTTSTTDS